MKITREFTFDSAHILPNHSGKCKRLHGHTYRMVVSVEAVGSLEAGASGEGMLMDFGRLDEIARHVIISKWDHRFLANGDEWPFQYAPEEYLDQMCVVHVRTTAENLAQLAAKSIHDAILLEVGPTELYVTVQLYETPKSYATVEYPYPGEQWDG